MKLHILTEAAEPILLELLTGEKLRPICMLPDFPRREDDLP